MTNDILFSIVTPSYNQAPFITQTIESVLNQSYRNFQYWVVDGGSTDGTVNILRNYEGDPRFNWISEPDKGQSDAINKGLARLNGDVFAWLNSDDVYELDTFEKVKNIFVEDKNLLVYGYVKFIDEYGSDMGYAIAQTPSMNMSKLLNFGRYFLTQPGVFMPLAGIREVGGVNTEFHYAMDFDLWVKLAQKYKFRHIDSVLAYYRLHSASKSISKPKLFIDDIDKILSVAADSGLLPRSNAKSITNLFASRLYFNTDPIELRRGCVCLWRAILANYLYLGDASLIFSSFLIKKLLHKKMIGFFRHFNTKINI